MDSNELLKGIQQRDTDAYLYLTQTYGWKLYAHLSAKLKDAELTNRAFNDTLAEFYNCLAGAKGEDAVESLLYAFADRTCQEMIRDPEGKTAGEMPVKTIPAQPAPQEPKTHARKKRGILASIAFWITALLLIVGILAALWIIVVLLMEMGFLPQVDLGYDWVRAKLAGWF